MAPVTEAGPSAFANIHENYYYVFVVCSAFFLVVAYFYFPYVHHHLSVGRTEMLMAPVKRSRKPWRKSLQPLATRLFWQMRPSGRPWLGRQITSRPLRQAPLDQRGKERRSCQGCFFRMFIPGRELFWTEG